MSSSNQYQKYKEKESKIDFRKKEEFKKINMMKQLLMNNPDLLPNFKKRSSKTPHKNRVRSNPHSLNPNKKNNNIQNINQINKLNPNQNIKNNKKQFRDMNTSPLMKHINIQSPDVRTIKTKKIEPKKPKNILSRSESFSILENRPIIKKEENNKKHNNSAISIDVQKKHKVCKKIFKIESLSQVGYSGPGIKKYNQDNFFIYKNLNDEKNTLYIGVCDGHGIVGHDVSKYLITHLPKNLNKELKKTNKYIHDKETLYKTMKEVFINTNKDLCRNPIVDTQFSGSTCVTIILKKNKIICANAGDSRAVMGRFINNEWINIDLSHDQKPNNPIEKERILKHGGRIEAYKDENGGDFGPPRVWLKNEDVPGLAMSRSFGDEVAASVGTISEPEIETFDITDDDKFIIVASDGIWEFISSKECVNMIKDFYLKKDCKGCLKYLLLESSKRWIKEEEVIDDITAVLIFFEN